MCVSLRYACFIWNIFQFDEYLTNYKDDLWLVSVMSAMWLALNYHQDAWNMQNRKVSSVSTSHCCDASVSCFNKFISVTVHWTNLLGRRSHTDLMRKLHHDSLRAVSVWVSVWQRAGKCHDSYNYVLRSSSQPVWYP